MTSRERRGKWVFLFLAALIVVDQLGSTILRLFPKEGSIRWMSVFQSLAMAAAVAMLWQGDVWLRRLMAAAFIFSGGVQLYFAVHIFRLIAAETPPEATAIMWQLFLLTAGGVAIVGAFYTLAGLALLLLPSLRAFFEYQRRRASY